MNQAEETELVTIYCPFQVTVKSKFENGPTITKNCYRRLANMSPGSSGELWCTGCKSKLSFFFSVKDNGEVKFIKNTNPKVIKLKKS